MSEYTTIVIRKETREKLKSIRLTKRESYEEIINRLLNALKNNTKEQYIIKA